MLKIIKVHTDDKKFFFSFPLRMAQSPPLFSQAPNWVATGNELGSGGGREGEERRKREMVGGEREREM